MEKWKYVFLPPNSTSVLQPVDATILYYFKCAFRRLLVDHLMDYVDKRMEIYGQEHPNFKKNHAVTTYAAIILMKYAWEVFPGSVILSECIKSDIISPLKRDKIVALRPETKDRVTAEENSVIQSVSYAEATLRGEAKRKTY